MNLAGFSAGMGNALPTAEQAYQNIQAGRLRIAQAIREQKAAEQRFAFLTSPTPPAAILPQQGPPGFAPQQAVAPLGQGGTGAAGVQRFAGTPSGPAPGSPQPAAPAPAMPAGGSSAPAPTAGGLQIPDPLIRLRQMAQALKAANPGADNATLAAALDQTVASLKGLAPEDRALMQAQIGLMNAQERYYATNVRSADTQRGQDVRASSAADTNQTRLAVAGQNNATRLTVADAMIRARQALAQSQLPDKETMDAIAEARSYGDTSVMSLGWSGTARTQIMGLAAQKAKARGTTLQQEDARYAGEKTAATTVGRISGATAQGGQEIQRFVPLITDISNRIDRTRFPTVNSVILAARRGTGDPDVVKLNSYIQSAKNAYVLIMTRSGRSTDQARQRSDELIGPNMPVAQIGAALQAMANEAAVAQSSAGGAMGEVTGRIGGGAAASGPPVPASGFAGQTIQGPDGSTWTSDGIKWTQQQR